MNLTETPEKSVTEFERIVPPEVQRVFDLRCEGLYTTHAEFRAAVREARLATARASARSAA